MIQKLMHAQFRSVKRWLKNHPGVILIVLFVTAAVGIPSYTTYMQNQRLAVDPASYATLLQVIAKAESKGNYNAYFGNATNTTIAFTTMSIAEVMQWQANYVRQGSISSAVGRYQLIDSTLAGLVRQMGIDVNQKFDEATQDSLAIALLERRGAESYINKELSADQFAANLAKEWAALPKMTAPNPSESYYASDGLNKSRISIQEIQSAIQPLKPLPPKLFPLQQN